MKYLIFISLALSILACDIKDNNVAADKNFIRIFADNNSENTYYPVDFVETSDKGYLIVSGLDNNEILSYPKIHILKTDKYGNTKWTYSNDNSTLSPTPSIISLNNQYYVFCMKNTLDCKLMKINIGETEGSIEESGYAIDAKYPLEAYLDENNNIVLLSFTNNFPGNNKSIIQKLNSSFNQLWTSELDAYPDNSIYFVNYHLNKQSNELPFFIGSMATANSINHYFVNCFTQQGLSTVFINSETGNSDGSITTNFNELNIEAAYSSMIYLHDSSFSMSRFYSNENYIHPKFSVKIKSNTHSSKLGNNFIHLPELMNNSKVSAIKSTFNNKELVVFAATTKTNQIALYFFDPNNSSLVKTYFLGNTNPVEVKIIKRGSDNSLLLLAKTWEAGRFQRIAFYKLSMEQLGF